MELWHAYSAVDDGEHILIVVGPVEGDAPRGDGQKWQDGYLSQGPHSNEPIMFDFITSFDHEPSSSERYFLVPEEHRQAYIENRIENMPTHEDFDDIEFLEEELKAVSLALQFRILKLQEIIDRRTTRGGISDMKVIQACEDQIECLLNFSDKLNLTTQTWEFDD